MERARTAALIPFAGRVVPEFKMPNLREVFVRTYRIVYRIAEPEVQVITVFEGHRLFPGDVDIEGDPDEREYGATSVCHPAPARDHAVLPPRSPPLILP